MASEWRTPDLDALLDVILRLGDREEALSFLRDLCTVGELHDMAQRWAVVRMLDAGLHYAEISRRSGASTATITRIASWLHHGEGGYRTQLDRLKAETGSVYPEADEA
ncbi:MAG: YerC/YecD family TrpR-related protein [Candidatus Limnocylindrales bacterium]